MSLDVLSASELSTGAPALGHPVLGQKHSLSVSALVAGAPALGAPAAGIDPDDLWPFQINWRSSVGLEFEFKTGIITSRNAREQRRAERDQPRKKWDYDFTIYGSAFREKMAQLTYRFGEEFLFANPMYKVELAADFDVSDPTLSVVSVPAWLVVGCYVVVGQSADRYAARVVAISGTDITLTGGNSTIWYAGTRLYLAEPVRISDDSVKVSALASDKIEGKSVLDVPPEAAVFLGEGVAGETFNGREVLLKTPNWASPVDTDLSSARSTIDYGQGRVAYFSPVPYVWRDLRASFVGKSIDEIEYIIGLFLRMKGRRGEFYFPTGTSDIQPATPLVSGGSTLRTAGAGYFIAFNNPAFTDSSTVLKAMILWLRDGTHLMRGIDSVALSSGDSVFHLDDTWPDDIPLAFIKKISFLPVCRFGSDTLSIDLLTNSVGQFSLAIHALESLDPE